MSTVENLRPHYEDALVSLAAKGLYDRERHGPFPTHLWEPLRQKLQQRWREATGEQQDILTIAKVAP